jgi:hypothetical protein
VVQVGAGLVSRAARQTLCPEVRNCPR